MEDRVKKLASLTHKDRVHLFNSKLEALSEHHDIPRVCVFDGTLVSCYTGILKYLVSRLARDKNCFVPKCYGFLCSRA